MTSKHLRRKQGPFPAHSSIIIDDRFVGSTIPVLCQNMACPTRLLSKKGKCHRCRVNWGSSPQVYYETNVQLRMSFTSPCCWSLRRHPHVNAHPIRRNLTLSAISVNELQLHESQRSANHTTSYVGATMSNCHDKSIYAVRSPQSPNT